MSIQAQFDKFLQTAHSKIAFEGPTSVGGACREAVLFDRRMGRKSKSS
jgi:hypothetical protein